jgi:hypothetical protein
MAAAHSTPLLAECLCGVVVASLVGGARLTSSSQQPPVVLQRGAVNEWHVLSVRPAAAVQCRLVVPVHAYGASKQASKQPSAGAPPPASLHEGGERSVHVLFMGGCPPICTTLWQVLGCGVFLYWSGGGGGGSASTTV